MPMHGGKGIPPMGKKVQVQMGTVGRGQHRVMDEECPFGGDQKFVNQVGLAP